jgi:thiamine-phosphate pyrophosphorylase
MRTSKLIVITVEAIFEGEATILNKLFEREMSVLHLRKPFTTEMEIRNLLEQIDKRFYDRIVLHDHFSLLNIFRLKGVHLNWRNPVAPEQKGISVSCSCHSLEELKAAGKFDYVFLSPIFESISKTGYVSAFSHETLQSAKVSGLINERVIALGGVSPKTIPRAAAYGFGGVAVLGALWDNFPKTKDENALMKRFDGLWTITQKQ